MPKRAHIAIGVLVAALLIAGSEYAAAGHGTHIGYHQTGTLTWP
jgi:hypothetical protein